MSNDIQTGDIQTGDALMPSYARLPVTFTEGNGSWLTDTNGKRYLDALSGIGVTGLGHAHPAVAQAICAQAKTLIHTSNLYHIPQQQKLAQQLTALANMEQVFFSNSGAEAVEAAIKIARLYGHNKGYNHPNIIVAENSFHGRTLATLSATGSRKVQAGFEPLVQGFIRVPYNDIEAIKTTAKNSTEIVAILVEPIQGEGGINTPDSGYLSELRKICDEHDWLLMLDEIQTGICRTGKWFAHQHTDIIPDVMMVAKALGNGVPIGACLAAGRASNVIQPGNHGSTFGGNPLVCSAALAVIDTMKSENLADRAAQVGQRIRDSLVTRLQNNKDFCGISGQGLMLGIKLARPCTELLVKALDAGLLCSIQAETVIRLLPPLTISDDEADQIVDIVATLVDAWTANTAN